MADPGVRYDDGTGGFATNCFPVRGIVRHTEEGGGAWLVSHRAEQRRRFKAVLCAKPRSYAQIQEEKKKALKEGTTIVAPPYKFEDEEEIEQILDGFFLMKHCCVEDPSDLCSVNISGQGLSEVKEDDLVLFDSVAYCNASENILPFGPFKSFPILRELELSLNGLRGIQVELGDYPHLEMLDLSYNNLSPEDILPLGLLPNLKVLHLTGNNFKTLPADIARPYFHDPSGQRIQRFGRLEILMLDDNKLSDLTTFATLAGLRSLQHLNLDKNEIYTVPQLMAVEGRHITQDSEDFKKKPKSGRKTSRKSSPRKSGKSSPAKTSGQSSAKNVSEPQMAASSGTVTLEEVKELVAKLDVQIQEEDKQAEQLEREAAEAAAAAAEVDDSTVVKEPASVEPKPAEEKQPGDLSFRELQVDDLNLEELNLDTIDEKVSKEMIAEEEERRKEAERQQLEAVTDPVLLQYVLDDGTSLPPPFPELRSLSMAYNQIWEEEGLLAIAAWPMLAELIIHNNPLTTETSGNPPILKRFLQDRLGIKIIRKKPGPLQKPNIEVPQKQSRKVQAKVPPIPKCNVEQLLALEASLKQKALPSSAASTPTSRQTPIEETSRPGSIDLAKPLPPIPATPESGEQSSERSKGDSQRSQAWEDRGEDISGQTQEKKEEADAFFMTQVEDQDEEKRIQPEEVPEEKPVREKRSKKKRKRGEQRPQSQYKGYEDLLDAEEVQDVPLPKDMQGSIRALKFALNHELVFRENEVELDQPQKPFRPYMRAAPRQGAPRKTKGQQIEEALHHVRDRSTVVEADLAEVLTHRQKYREFSDAPYLLEKIQRRYNAVRASSMTGPNEARQMLEETIKTLPADKLKVPSTVKH